MASGGCIMIHGVGISAPRQKYPVQSTKASEGVILKKGGLIESDYLPTGRANRWYHDPDNLTRLLPD